MENRQGKMIRPLIAATPSRRTPQPRRPAMSMLFPGRRRRLLPVLAAGIAVLALTLPALAIDTGGDDGAPAARWGAG